MAKKVWILTFDGTIVKTNNRVLRDEKGILLDPRDIEDQKVKKNLRNPAWLKDFIQQRHKEGDVVVVMTDNPNTAYVVSYVGTLMGDDELKKVEDKNITPGENGDRYYQDRSKPVCCIWSYPKKNSKNLSKNDYILQLLEHLEKKPDLQLNLFEHHETEFGPQLVLKEKDAEERVIVVENNPNDLTFALGKFNLILVMDGNENYQQSMNDIVNGHQSSFKRSYKRKSYGSVIDELSSDGAYGNESRASACWSGMRWLTSCWPRKKPLSEYQFEKLGETQPLTSETQSSKQKEPQDDEIFIKEEDEKKSTRCTIC